MNRNNTRKFAALPLSLTLGLAAFMPATAGATIYTTIFSGTVASGYDADGSFGIAPNQNVAGLPFSVTFTVDDSQGTYSSGAGYAAVQGGTGFGTSNPVTSVLTVNGVSESIDTNIVSGEALVVDDAAYGNGYSGGQLEYGDTTSYNTGPNIYFNIASSSNFVDLPSLGTGVTNPIIADIQHQGLYTASYANFVFDVTSLDGAAVVVPAALAVPEPQSWIIALIGFSVIETVLRRRSRGAPAALGYAGALS